VTLSTQNASLADVIQEGKFSLEHELVSNELTTSIKQAKTLGVASEQSGNAIVTTLGWNFVVNNVNVNVAGSADFQIKFILESEFSSWSLKRLKLAVQTTMSIELTIQTDGSVTVSKDAILWKQYINPLVFWVGILPILIVPEISVGAGVSLALESPNLSTSLTSTITTTAGFEWIDGQLRPVGDISHQETYDPPSGNMKGDLSGYAIAPRLTLFTYGVAGPYVDLRPYLKLHTETPSQGTDYPWTLFYGIKGTAGVRLNSIFDLKIVGSMSINVFDLEWKLTEGVFDTGSPTAPSAPINLIATPGNGQISLSWQLPTSDGGSPITNYRIYRSTSSGNEILLLQLSDVLAYTDSGLTNGVTYFYQVSAVNALGESQRSIETSVTPIQSGGSWVCSTIDSTGVVGNDPHIAIDSNNKVHIIYLDNMNGDVKYATNAGGSWVCLTTGLSGDSDSIALDSNNKVHISYRSFSNALMYATNAGGSWVSSTIDSAGGSYTSIAFDSNNKVHISYCTEPNYDLKYATNAGGSWAYSTIDSVGYVGLDNSIAIDSNNKVHISYRDNSNYDLKYATNAGGSWICSTIDSAGMVGYDTSIAVDSNNKVHISYVDESNAKLKYATNAGGSWVCSTVDGLGGYTYDTSIAVDSNNKVHISYYDGVKCDLRYATNAGGSWVSSTVDNAGDVGSDNSIAIDSNNKVHISYLDFTNSDLKYATNT